MSILAVEVSNFPPKLSHDVVLAMMSTVSKWPNLSVRGEEKVILYVILYEDNPLPRIKCYSKIF